MASIMHKRRPAIIERLEWALRQPIKHSARVVLTGLVCRANKAGECWPEIRTIAEDTCTGLRTVERSIRTLEARGLVTITRKPILRRGRSGTRNHYVLHFDREATKPPTVAGRTATTKPSVVHDQTANGCDGSNHGRGLTGWYGVSNNTGGDGGTLAEAVKRGRI